MRVGVGSENPAKVAATEAAFEKSGVAATVAPVSVESGVSEQPRGHAETVAGAENRARAALAAGYDLGVGLEGGVARFDRGAGTTHGASAEDGARVICNANAENARTARSGSAGGGAREDDGASADGFEGPPGLYLVMWAAATDGERAGRGAGPSVRLPDVAADRVRDGEELGPVMDDAVEGGVGRCQGAAGALTGGVIDREAALLTAVAGALGPFLTDRY